MDQNNERAFDLNSCILHLLHRAQQAADWFKEEFAAIKKDLLFWGTLAFALAVAGAVAFPVNRWLITRGKGHAVLHESGHHPSFPTRAVAAVAMVAFLFGSVVLVAEAF